MTTTNNLMLWYTFFIWNDLDIMKLCFVLLSHNNMINRTLTPRPATYVTIWDSCFMNKALQMTKFSPSANYDPGSICIPISIPKTTRHPTIANITTSNMPIHITSLHFQMEHFILKTLFFLLWFHCVRSIKRKSV